MFPPINRIVFARACVALLVCSIFLPAIRAQQSLGTLLSGSKSTAQPAADDPLRRSTPRNSIYNFLQACHDDNLLLASQYLDLKSVKPDERATAGPELAQDLCDFLDHDAHFEVGHLSNDQQGDPSDGLNPDLDVLDRYDEGRRSITLYLQRTDVAGKQLWLVAPESVEKLGNLPNRRTESDFEKRLPQPLVNIEWIDTPLWVWIALVLFALLLSFVSGLLSRSALLVAGPLIKRFVKSLDSYRLENFSEPVRLLLGLIAFRAFMTFVAPSALLRDYLLKIVVLLAAFGFGSLFMRVVDLVSDRIITHLNPQERTVSYSVAPLLVRFVKICIFCCAVLFVLAAWGYNTTTILAGVGVGGLAVALAAQKTIENLFGGISLISDRAVLVGDFCQFGGQVGTVEDIGLRSTRIRTLDRTLVTIPNSQFSTMTLENFSKRDRMWFHPTLHLHRETPPSQIRLMMTAVERILQQDQMVDPTDVPLRFTKINNDSYSLEIFAYVLTPDYNQFLKVQSNLLLQILEASHRLGIVFALPIQENVSATTSPVSAEHIEVDA